MTALRDGSRGRRPTPRLLGALTLLVALAPALRARAETGEETGPLLLLLAPPDGRAELAAALRLELAARDARVSEGDPPSAETALLRDASAQRAARAAGADLAVWIERTPRGGTIHVIGADWPAGRSTPILAAPDARTIALVADSLLDEPVGHTVAELAPPTTPTPAGSEAETVEPEAPEPDAFRPRAYGIVGVGAVAFTDDAPQLDVGGVLRGGVGYRFDPYVALGILGDLGMVGQVTDQTLGYDGLLARLCIEPTFTLPLSDVALHAGSHVCGVFGYAHTAMVDLPTDSTVPVHAWDDGVTAGGFLAISLPMTAATRFWIRAELDGVVTRASNPVVLPELSAMVSW